MDNMYKYHSSSDQESAPTYTGKHGGDDIKIPEFCVCPSKRVWIHGSLINCTCCSSCAKSCEFCCLCKTCDCCDVDCCKSCAKCNLSCKSCCESCKLCPTCKCCDACPSCAKCKLSCDTSCVKCCDSCCKLCVSCKCFKSCDAKCKSCMPCLNCECCSCGPECKCRPVGCMLCYGPCVKMCGNWHMSTDMCWNPCPAFCFPLCFAGCQLPCCCGQEEKYSGDHAGNPLSSGNFIQSDKSQKDANAIAQGKCCNTLISFIFCGPGGCKYPQDKLDRCGFFCGDGTKGCGPLPGPMSYPAGASENPCFCSLCGPMDSKYVTVSSSSGDSNQA